MDAQEEKKRLAINLGCLGLAGCITIWPIVWFIEAGGAILIALEIVSLLCILGSAFGVFSKLRAAALMFAVGSLLMNFGVIIFGIVSLVEYSGEKDPAFSPWFPPHGHMGEAACNRDVFFLNKHLTTARVTTWH